MKIHSASVLLLTAALVGSVASTFNFPCYGWGTHYGPCHENWANICDDFATCPSEPEVPEVPEAPATTVAPFSTVAPGYTPGPGECVCVSDGPSTGFPTVASTGLFSTGAPDYSTPAAIVELLCPCKLVNFFWELRSCFTGVHLDIYDQWLMKLQKIVMLEGLTEKEKFCQMAALLTTLFEKHPIFLEVLQFKQLTFITNIEFYVCDIITVAIELSIEVDFTQTMLVVVDESCHFLDCLMYNLTVEGEDLTYCMELILLLQGHMVACEAAGYSHHDKYILIYKELHLFFQSHPHLKEIILSIHIAGFGLVAELFAVCQTYFEIYALSASIGSGSGTIEDCAMMQAFQAACYDFETYGNGTCAQFQQLYAVFVAQLEDCTDLHLRLELLFNITWEYKVLNGWACIDFWSVVWECEFEGVYLMLNFHHLLWLHFFKYQYGFHCNLPLPVIPDTTTEAFETTAEVTATTPTTAAPFDGCTETNLCDLFMDSENPSDGFIYSLLHCELLAPYAPQMAPIINRCHNQHLSTATVVNWQQITLNMFYYLAKKPYPSAQHLLVQCEIHYQGHSYGRLCDIVTCGPLAAPLSANSTLFCGA